MKSKGAVYTQKQKKILEQLGENIRLARLRRKLSSKSVAERAGIAVSTMTNVEKGEPGVGIGTYLVLSVLQLAEDILLIADKDPLGRRLQDNMLLAPKRAPKKKKVKSPIEHVIDDGTSPKPEIK